jgi:two-component system, OmpR family, alkaline phosphatase synthesis response regulator PhoP
LSIYNLPLKKFTILLVEDEKNLLSTIKLNLELEGYEVIAFMNAEDAWFRYKNMAFSLIILDVTLPGMNGYELCEHIRKADKKTPILFLTSRSSAEDRISGLKLGADDYLAKPFHLEELLLRVKSLLKRSATDSEITGRKNIVSGIASSISKHMKYRLKKGKRRN